ncbi:hypothetical protein SNEBB_001393 [Seison nebaliae]|nr:hypothetical protein SNEBB_001393 [Seison nebaliae]
MEHFDLDQRSRLNLPILRQRRARNPTKKKNSSYFNLNLSIEKMSVIVDTLKKENALKTLEKYDSSVCENLKKTLDKDMKANGNDFDDIQKEARQNILLFSKWQDALPSGLSECLREYWTRKAVYSPKFDPRFPNSNQSRNCYINYVDFHRCRKIKGEDYKPCEYFKRVYQSICPDQWTESWDDQMEKGAFPGHV